MSVGVMGCVRSLPPEFPITKSENAGNMIHGDAPFKIVPGAISAADREVFSGLGYSSFVDFVNNECSHLILTLANTLRLDRDSLPNLKRMESFVSSVKKPIVVFGLGAQSQTRNVEDQHVPSEAVSLLRLISERTPALGVRGEFTAEVLRRKVGIDNAYVTGCPSIFSRPAGLASLRGNLDNMRGRPAFNGTKYHLSAEKKLLNEAVMRDYFLVEPVNRFNHEYAASVIGGAIDVKLPYFLNGFARHLSGSEGRAQLASFFQRRYRLFRNVDDWVAFNSEAVSFSFGTRFHVNMACLLSGKPALWLSHDARTEELVEYLGLPSRKLDGFALEKLDEMDWAEEYSHFFDRFETVRERFANYLNIHDLPTDRVGSDLFNQQGSM